MIPKKNRADKKAIGTVFREGQFFHSLNFNFKFILTNSSLAPRISFIVPKSTAKLAVTRNSLRRIGYNVLKKYINNFPVGIVGVFVFKKYEKNISILENEIKTVLAKIN